MKKYFFSLLLVPFFTFASTDEKTDLRKINQQVAEKLLAVVGGCGERIWPGYNLKKMNIVLVDKSSEDLLAVSIKENKTFTVKSSELPASVIRSSYSFFKIDDQSWMSINSEIYNNPNLTDEQKTRDLFGLAIHEAFHNQAQESWKIEVESRGTFVPVKWQPRYYRAMVYNNLLAALNQLEDKSEYLQKAKYWYNKWVSENSEEIKSATDGYEGSAQYAEAMGIAFSELGCQASDTEILNFVRSEIPNNILGTGDLFLGYQFALDGEGYALGGLSGLLLNAPPTSENWYSLVERGETPLFILLQNVSPTKDDDNFELMSQMKQTQIKEQKQVDSYLSDMYSALNQQNSYLISIPHSWSEKGSKGYVGFYVDTALKMEISVLGQELNFLSEDKSSTLKTAKNAVFLNLDSPCRKSTPWMFVVGSISISFQNGNSAVVTDNYFNGKIQGKLIQDSDGKNWFCAGEN